MDRVIDQFSSYAEALFYADLSPSAVHATKHRVIDSLGCVLGAYLEEPCKIARRMCLPVDSAFSARVIGSLMRTSPDSAAFANGLMGSEVLELIKKMDRRQIRPSISAGRLFVMPWWQR